MPYLSIFLAITLTAFSNPLFAEKPDLPKSLSEIIDKSNIPKDAISLVIYSIDNQKQIAALNPATNRIPASLVKIIPTWVALETLGPSYSWKTEIRTLGNIENGVLNGDLVFKGLGDPFLVIEDLWHIVQALSRKGLHHIDGNFLIDSRYFSPINPTPIDGDPLRLYNVSPSATMVNFKWIDLIVNPTSDGTKARVNIYPDLDNLNLVNKLKISDKPCRGNHPRIQLESSDDLGTITISGKLPRACRNYTLSRTALSSDAYLYGLFKKLLSDNRGDITGVHLKATPQQTSESRLFYTWNSKPLVEVVTKLNKWSNNLMARSLVYSIGAELMGAPGSKEKGVKAIKQYLTQQGLDLSGMLIDNGSGLSRSSRISTNLLNEILNRAWRSPLMPEFASSLSIAGKDGTTRRRFLNPTIENKVRIKTGTLNNVSSAGGYVFGQSGEVFSFALITNYPRVERVLGPKFQEALVEWITRL